MTVGRARLEISLSVSPVVFITTLFIVMKLTGFLDWNWAWVLSPLWLAACMWTASALILYSIALFIAFFKR